MKRIILFFAITLMALGGTRVFAVDPNIWRQDQNFEVIKSPYLEGPVEKGNCTMTDILVMNAARLINKYSACVMEANGVSIARYTDVRPYPLPSVEMYAVMKNGDSLYHVLEGISPAHLTFQLLARSGYLLAHNILSGLDTAEPDYALYRNTASAFYYDAATAVYNYDKSSQIPLLFRNDPDNASNYSNIVDLKTSKNGKYAVALVDYKFVVKIDLSTGEELIIAKLQNFQYFSIAPSAGAISDDGRYILVGNLHYIFNTQGTCGEKTGFVQLVYNYTFTNLCPFSSLNSALTQAIPYEYAGVMYEFDNNDTVIKFVTYYLYSPNATRENIEVRSDAYVKPTTSRYIALGDSFSSGEGDVVKGASAHYVNNSGYAGGCHLSDRSYPFRLATLTKLDASKMRSVACSGALLQLDMLSSNGIYMGQGNRIANLTSTEANQARTRALADFTPGIIQQVNFVKNYKPKYITLTAGGNDVGFAKILTYCAGKQFTCDYAKDGTELRSLLLGAIKMQKSNMTTLIKQIKQYSPTTVIYVVGYPKIIADNRWCQASVGLLNHPEKRMIDEGVSLLNQTLQVAASQEGAYFVNIQDAFFGGRLCEGAHMYMTGIDDLTGGVLNSSSDLNQTFHPNPQGHEKIAQAILQQFPKIDQSSTNPPISQVPLKAPLDGAKLPISEHTTAIVFDASTRKLLISVRSNTFKPNSSVRIVLHSDEAVLGYTKAASDGSVSASYTLPKQFESGEHIAIAKGTDNQNNDKYTYGFITIGDSNLIHVNHGRCKDHSAKPEKARCEEPQDDRY